MRTPMLSKLGHGLAQLNPSAMLAGDSMVVRLRSSIFGILGAVTIAGLCLVAVAANQGWPVLPQNPIPGLGKTNVESARVVATPVDRGVAPSSRPAVPAGRAEAGSGSAAQSGGAPSGGSNRNDVAVSQPTAQAPSSGGGVAPPVDSPSGPGSGPAASPAPGEGTSGPAQPSQPSSPAAPPAEAPVTDPPVTSSPGNSGSSNGNGKAKGHEKKAIPSTASPTPVAPAPAPAPVPSAPEPSPGNGKGKGHAYGHEK